MYTVHLLIMEKSFIMHAVLACREPETFLGFGQGICVHCLESLGTHDSRCMVSVGAPGTAI